MANLFLKRSKSMANFFLKEIKIIGRCNQLLKMAGDLNFMAVDLQS